jgi:hypothetical protein
LGLERNGQVGRDIDNVRAKVINFAGVALHASGKLAGLGVETHTQEGAVLALSALQLF